MKKIIALALTLVVVLTGCSTSTTPEATPTPEADGVDYAGTYVGYSWKGEVEGVTLEEATQKIETTLTLDSSGVITDVQMLFLVQDKEGNWYSRTETDATVEVDFSKTPTLATLETDTVEYVAGDSMFSIKSADKMAFYAAAVDEDGTVALAIVDPYSRYQFEFKLDADFDFSTPMKDMTIGSGLVVPTVRTSSSGYVKPKLWDDYNDYSILSFAAFAPVLTNSGVFEGLTEESTIKEFLEKTGIMFEEDMPTQMDVTYGFTGLGGWSGNYQGIANYLIGKNATEVTSLIDWENARYSGGINEDNFFGVDVETGATKTVQNSYDTISGATVRMSRESNSYQRALVEAGIIEEEAVIKARF